MTAVLLAWLVFGLALGLAVGLVAGNVAARVQAGRRRRPAGWREERVGADELL